MRLLSYACQNYKPFKKRVEVKLRPLTLVYGRNSSGKSALVRLPRLILRAISQRANSVMPLQVDELSYGRHFIDLLHGREAHGEAGFSISIVDEEQSLIVNAKIQNIIDDVSDPGSPREYAVVSRLDLVASQEQSFVWNRNRGVASYEGMTGVEFRGLLPDAIGNTDQDFSEVREWRDRVRDFEIFIEHLGPHRAEVRPIYETSHSQSLGLDGEGAPRRLIANGMMLEQVGAWFQEHLDGWRLTVEQNGNAFACVIARGSTRVNLADAGQGMQQVLPIIIQQISRQLGCRGPFLDIVEQPELHLHTAAQAPLGDLFLDTATMGVGQLIVETHSENILLRVRRRIAEGRVAPDLVGVYWVEDLEDGTSEVREIKISRTGELDWWRPGVFSEGYEEVRAIRRAGRA